MEEYWIDGKEFYEMLRLDIAGYPGVSNQMETGALIVEMEEKKHDTILAVLAKWEEEDSNLSTVPDCVYEKPHS